MWSKRLFVFSSLLAYGSGEGVTLTCIRFFLKEYK